MNFLGTKTEQNVKKAFACESQARNKYAYFALQARNEGNEKIAALFEEMAKNETEHAKVWFKFLNNGLGESTENLLTAAEGEHEEWVSMYPAFAQTAREEGLELLAIMFDNIASIEKTHENRFLQMLGELKKDALQHTKVIPAYICKNCGNPSEAALEECPVCSDKNCSIKND